MSEAASVAANIFIVPIHEIALSMTESQQQRRARFSEAQLEELAASIRDHGVLQPIIVRPLEDPARSERYELVAGERRLLAAKIVGHASIPAVVRQLTDEEVLEVQLIENLQRADLHPMEEAEGYAQLLKHGRAVEELHARFGKSVSYVYGRLKLLSLSEKCREAFYADKISASIALLLARIPNETLQNAALAEITGDGKWDPGLTLAEAKQMIRERYMLRLAGAPFPTKDETLPGGPCTTCPKRTGNQPELFEDVKGTDLCTDPTCFEAKTREHGKRALAAAKKEGRRVLSAAEVKREKHGFYYHYINVDGNEWIGETKYKIRDLVEPSDIILAPDPNTGAAIELVERRVYEAALRKRRRQLGISAERTDAGTRDRQRKAKIEKDFRRRLYEELRPYLRDRGVTMLEIAQAIVDRMPLDALALVCEIRGCEVPAEKTSWGTYTRNYKAIVETLPGLSDSELELFIADCIYAPELIVRTWSDAEPEKLLALAAEVGVDVAAIRREVCPKKKTAKKKAAKKKRSKSKTAETEALR